MEKYGKPEVALVSAKGQVVIPQAVRVKLGIKPRSRLLVYGYRNTLIMRKMDIPDVVKDLEGLYRRIDKRIAKYGELSDEEIDEIIQKYRKRGR